MTEVAPEAYLTHAGSLVLLLGQTLNSVQDLGHPVAYYVLKIMQNLVLLVEGDQMVNYMKYIKLTKRNIEHV